MQLSPINGRSYAKQIIEMTDQKIRKTGRNELCFQCINTEE